MQKLSILLVLFAICCVSFADKNDCTYAVTGSEADDFAPDYKYCNDSGPLPITPAKITADLTGYFNTCNILEPNLDDTQLEDKLGIKIRPYFKALFINDTHYTFGQYPAGCLFAQRISTMTYRVKQCKQGVVSEGYVHEIYLNGSSCYGLGNLNADNRTYMVSSQFVNYYDSTTNTILSDLQSKIIDPYPTLAYLTKQNYTVNHKVLTKAYTSLPILPTADGTGKYCYGVGSKFAIPFHLPIITSGGKYYNNLFFPNPSVGLVCAYNCMNDVSSALTSAGAAGDVTKAPFFFANTTCGRLYHLWDTYNATSGKLPDSTLFFAGYIMSMGLPDTVSPVSCNACINDLSQDPITRLLYSMYQQNNVTTPLSMVPKSKFIVCQTDIHVTNWVYQDDQTSKLPENPNNCTMDMDMTSAGVSVSVFSALFSVIAALAYLL